MQKLVLVSTIDNRIQLKGAFYITSNPNQLIFLGNIQPDQLLSSFKEHISIRVFPAHDSFSDFLFSQQANTRALSELKRHNDEIIAHKNFMKNILSSIRDMYAVVNMKGVIKKVNQSLLDTLNYKGKGLLG